MFLATYLSNYFEPVADFYDDCGASDVMFMYTVRIRATDLPVAFLNEKNRIIVILMSGNVCISRWSLRMKSKESALSVLSKKSRLSRLKFKVGRSSLLKDVQSVRLDHNWYGETISIDQMEIVDRNSNQTMFQANIPRHISMLPVVCDEDMQQVFPAATPLPAAGPEQRNSIIGNKITLTEYLMFACFAISILLIGSLHFPYAAANLTRWNGIANGFVAATVAMTITFCAFAAYKLVIRRLWKPALVKFAVLALLLGSSIILSVLAVSHSNINSAGADAAPGAWWLSGFIFGIFLIVVVGMIFLHLISLITSLIEGRKRPPQTRESVLGKKEVSALQIDSKVSAPASPIS